jgi:LytS/YehU family sensor histidine kinase
MTYDLSICGTGIFDKWSCINQLTESLPAYLSMLSFFILVFTITYYKGNNISDSMINASMTATTIGLIFSLIQATPWTGFVVPLILLLGSFIIKQFNK